MIDDSTLFHGNYDPVKAREYYLRTRKLKGRKHGTARPEGPGRSGGRQGNVSAVGGRPNRSKTKSRRAELEAQKKALTARLEHLRNELRKLVDAAQKRSGQSEKKKAPETKVDKADRNKAEKGSKPLTQHQKSEKAKAAKKAYEKEHPNSLSQDVDVLHEQIKDIRAKIEKAMADARRNKAGQKDSKSGSNHQTSGPRGR